MLMASGDYVLDRCRDACGERRKGAKQRGRVV